ncbi:MAG: hypothetical protein KIT84_20140 [Labilithrix sp.]|nr:hypothetical protein [Labilithrix sp.]MCW5813350.1 hypothetical protein [Labilithrix sp.]
MTDHAGSWVPPVCERNLSPIPLRSTIPFGRWLPRSVALWLTNSAPSRARLYCGQFNELAEELGVEIVPSFAALLLGDLTLVTDCPEVLGISAADLEAWKPHPSRYRAGTKLRYVGPLFAELSAPVPERVEQFLNAGADRPTVYVAMTSTPESLIRGVVQGARAADVRVVVASTVHDLDDLAGEDVIVEKILPSHRIMPRVNLAIIAGGQGSVQTAMAGGTPFLGIPLQPEQDFNIVEMERHGAARRVSQEDAISPRMTAMVKEVLGDASFKLAAERIRAIYAKADGPGAAAEAILELVGHSNRARTTPSGATWAMTAKTSASAAASSPPEV